MGRSPRFATAFSFFFGLVACSAPAPDTARTALPIRGGYRANEQTGVVGVVNFSGGQCSGSLLGPRLVLTARHCIADLAREGAGVVCGESAFTDSDSAGAVFVISAPEISEDPANYRAVSAIRTDSEDDDDLCGTDVALLQLKEPIADVTALEPRLADEVIAGEPYTAVGYGNDEALPGNPSGVRKELGDRSVTCAGRDCDTPSVRDNEWVGSSGPCHGDSGGPALDEDGRVVGVLSRGTDHCGSPVYGSVVARSAWLRAEALALAQARNEVVPEWARASGSACGDEAACAPSQTCDVERQRCRDDAKAEELDSSCALRARGRAGAWDPPALGLGFAGLARWRQRRRRRRLSNGRA